ncbi:phage virion morphogenesis protein [Thiofaba sp. EF100]|uniref:phage virion morphogenesis protein n=1 Tax=Thiofaba sp. EF100 TaxID=3121274 RepID=UPI003221D1F9
MIKIDYDDRDVLDAIQALARRTSDLSQAMQDIAGVLADAVERAFDQEHDPATGMPWAPLAPRTIKARGGDAHPILQRSGQLASSIVTEHGKDYAIVGSNKRYAAIHQFGGQAGRKRKAIIPARPYLGLGEEDKGEIMDIVRGYLGGALSKR